MQTETATFGAGCFWGVEAAFAMQNGVLDTCVGYSGGTSPNPTYREVCSDRTGHVEVARVEFDPRAVSYEQLLDLFWKIHDPTTLNRQGPDVGSQYRSVIFTHSPEQELAAQRSREALDKSGLLLHPVVTEIVPAGPFYPAEEYHQGYLWKMGVASCHLR